MAFSNIFIKAGFWKKTNHPTKGDLSLDDVVSSLIPAPPAPEDPYIQGYAALGSTIKATTLGIPIGIPTSSAALADGQLVLSAVYISSAQTITGVKWIQVAQGNYTADNYNGVGLYSYSAGTYTLVASSTNDGNIWKATASLMSSKAFSTPYSASQGIYFIGILYNNSAEVTAPTIAGNSGSASGVSTLDLTNSAKITSVLASQTSLPLTTTGAVIGTTNTRRFLALY